MQVFFILVWIVFFCSGEVKAQNKQQASYGGVNSDLAVSVSVLNDGSIITFSTSNSFSNSKDFLLSKINKKGNVEWSKIYGGEDIETAVHFEKTSDNGYVLLGNTISYGNGNEDIYIIKTDSVGNILWSKTYGGASGDFSGCVKEVPSGGYIIAGRTQSFGEGSDDGYLVRIDANGNIIWSQSYGTTNNERFYYADCTNDNGFIISGIQKNFSNYFDQLVIKVNANGVVEFSKNFGDASGSGNDAGDCIKQTSDGGYILSGQYRAFGSGGEDLGLTKIDALGNIQWAKVYGNIGDDRAFDISIDQSGNFLLAGYTNSFGLGGFDGFLVKVNQFGSLIWSKTYGYISNDYFSEIEIAQNGYIMAGYTTSFGLGQEDIFIVKTDFDGLDNISCTNINIIDNNVLPIETNIIQLVNSGGLSSSPLSLTNIVNVTKANLLNLNQPEIDSVYSQGSYEVPLDGSPLLGSFKVDGINKSYFQPSILGDHLIKYEYEIVPGCIYSYEKNISVIDICKYKINDLPLQCTFLDDIICIPLVTTGNIGNGVKGIEYCLKYDPAFIQPSGSFVLSDAVTHGNVNWADARIDSITTDKIKISVNYTNSAPIETSFSEIGEIICVEFRLKKNIPINEQYDISVCSLKEIHDLFVVPTCGRTGKISLSGTYEINGTVFIEGDTLLSDLLIDNITSLSIRTEDSIHSVVDIINLDKFKGFKVRSDSKSKLFFAMNSIQIPPHLLLKYRNGFDAFQMGKIVTNEIGSSLQIEPSAFTMVAADVDISDKIRSNDISLLQEVIVKKIQGFPQQLPAELQQDYIDWRFIDQRSVDREEAFKKASQYPYYSSKGYCRDNVPDIPFYLSNQGSCDTSYRETYHAIFLGDLVDGGSGISIESFDHHTSSITLDIDDVHDLGNNTYRVFLNHKLNAQDKFVSLDLALDYDETAVSIVNTQMTVEDKQAVPQWLYNDYNSEEVLFTSYSMNGYPLEGKLLHVDIQKMSGVPVIEDLGQLYVFVNGTEVPSTIRLRSQTSTGIDIANDVSSFVNLYPNPTDANLTISLPLLYAKDVHIEFLNVIGQSVMVLDNEQAQSEIECDLSSLPAGLYECLISIEGKATVMKKVIVR
ncbi:MAG: T9SS type A sorting domain-containing protein [Cytophagaceae bacterium]|nr:T9SS type A sorting domain-containing protein [Cytophagaceae bacterium]